MSDAKGQRRDPLRAARRLRRALMTLAVLAGACLVSCMREDELHCEDAVAHIESCCPGSAQNIRCEYDFGFCDTTVPGLSVEASRCISAASCDQLVNTLICGGASSLACGGYGL